MVFKKWNIFYKSLTFSTDPPIVGGSAGSRRIFQMRLPGCLPGYDQLFGEGIFVGMNLVWIELKTKILHQQWWNFAVVSFFHRSHICNPSIHNMSSFSRKSSDPPSWPRSSPPCCGNSCLRRSTSTDTGSVLQLPGFACKRFVSVAFSDLLFLFRRISYLPSFKPAYLLKCFCRCFCCTFRANPEPRIPWIGIGQMKKVTDSTFTTDEEELVSV